MGSCEGKTRQKRTLGTVLQFFGYKLVPIAPPAINEQTEPFAEKLKSPEEFQRNPKFMRLQTVMPFEEISETTMATMETPFKSNKFGSPVRRQTPAPMAETSTTEAPIEEFLITATESELLTANEASTTNLPLRIILEDQKSFNEPPPMLSETSQQPPQPLKEENQIADTTTESFLINAEVSSTESSDEQDEPNQHQNFETPLNLRPDDVNSLSFDSRLNSYDPHFSSFDLPNKNFEIIRSNDVSHQYFGHQAFPSFGRFPQQHFTQPQPFSAHQESPQFSNHYSTSRTAMNLNGQQFDYLTYHG